MAQCVCPALGCSSVMALGSVMVPRPMRVLARKMVRAGGEGGGHLADTQEGALSHYTAMRGLVLPCCCFGGFLEPPLVG